MCSAGVEVEGPQTINDESGRDVGLRHTDRTLVAAKGHGVGSPLLCATQRSHDWHGHESFRQVVGARRGWLAQPRDRRTAHHGAFSNLVLFRSLTPSLSKCAVVRRGTANRLKLLS